MPIDLASRAVAIVEHLSHLDPWRASLAGAAVDPTALTVRTLKPDDEHRTSYVIFNVRNGIRITAHLALDPATADLIEIEGVQRADHFLPPFVDPIAAAREHLKEAASVVNNGLVWRYCAQSTSLFRPFWQVTAGSLTLYVRSDGIVYTALTDVHL